MEQKREIPLFIIDSSRSHGRGWEKDFVACTSKELPWYGEITLLNEQELEIDQDWTMKNPLCAYTERNEAGIRAKLKVTSAPGGLFVWKENRSELQSLMRRCMKEWRIRRGTVAVDMDDISKFAETLLEQTRENLRENPKDKQAYMVGCILTKIKNDYSNK